MFRPPALPVATFVAVLLLLLQACAPLAPYRVIASPEPPPDCSVDGDGLVPEGCRQLTHEHAARYDVYFVEFDDQGLSYPFQRDGKAAAYQINDALAGIRRHTDAGPVSLLVFVHGWKHNARHDDANLRDFRRLLDAATVAESRRALPSRVVGLYVSWRGLSNSVWPFTELTFWTRKAAALHVAQGSSRELFSRLRGLQCTVNATRGSGDCERAPGAAPPRLRMLLIGHSFGGLILFNAISGALIESLTHATGSADGAISRYGDMVVLLNPAFEATRYIPLHRIATTTVPDRYQAPLFVSVTSQADWATRVAFPLGRRLSTFFERTVSEEEDVANRRTIGHVPDYVTHELTVTWDTTPSCRGWRPLAAVPPAERLQQFLLNRQAEERNARAFVEAQGRAPAPGWVRIFCGGARLAHVAHPPTDLVWNVHTNGDVMADHGDIMRPVLIDFVRELYEDVLLAPRLR